MAVKLPASLVSTPPGNILTLPNLSSSKPLYGWNPTPLNVVEFPGNPLVGFRVSTGDFSVTVFVTAAFPRISKAPTKLTAPAVSGIVN
jgi:hypothetical protein